MLLGKTRGRTALFTLTVPQTFDFARVSLSINLRENMSEYSEATDSCYSGLVEEKGHITTFALNILKCEHHQTGPLDPL